MQKSNKNVPIEAAERKHAPLNSSCIVCGAHNSKGLQLRFVTGLDGASSRWRTTQEWESFRGTIHGGIIGTVLDEAMSQAIIARGWEAFTAELRVRFRSRIAPGEELRVRGWVVERNKRRIETEAVITATGGEEKAHAWGIFLVAKEFS